MAYKQLRDRNGQEAGRAAVSCRSGSPKLILGTATVDVTLTWPSSFPDANCTVTPPDHHERGPHWPNNHHPKTRTSTSTIITVTTTALPTVGALVHSAVAIRKNT